MAVEMLESVAICSGVKDIEETGSGGGRICGRILVESSVVSFVRPSTNLPAGISIGSDYRVEARVAGAWRPVQLVSSGCSSIE